MPDVAESVVVDFNQYRAKVLAEALVNQIGVEVAGPALDFARQLHRELKENFGAEIEFDAVVEGHGDLFRVIETCFPE